MKPNISAPHIALLCACLLAAFSASSAQKHRAPQSPTTKSQIPEQLQTRAPQHVPSLQGTFNLVDPDAATKIVTEAIDAAVKGVSIFLKGTVRDRLKQANLPPPQQLIISYTATDVTITTEAGTIQTPADGTFVDRTIKGEERIVSTKWKDGTLERTFKSGDGERVNTYSLSPDGKTLTLSVTFTSKWLKQPGAYELHYVNDQADDLIRLKQVTAEAEVDLKTSFATVEPKRIKSSDGNKRVIEAYDPRDIIDLTTVQKNKLVAALSGERFAALRAYTEEFYPIPEDPLQVAYNTPPHDRLTDSRGKVYFRSLSPYQSESVLFIRQIASLSEPGQFAVDVTIDSEPDMADYEMSADGGAPLTTTTKNVLRNVYRGYYTYKLSKPGYKTIEGKLNLVDSGSELKCTLNKTTDPDGPHACKQQ